MERLQTIKQSGERGGREGLARERKSRRMGWRGQQDERGETSRESEEMSERGTEDTPKGIGNRDGKS